MPPNYYLAKSKTNSVRTPEYVLSIVKKLLNCKELFDPCEFNPEFDKTKHTDGLTINWNKHTFVNPPYSRCGPWVTKARAECIKGNTVALLVKLDVLSRKYFAEVASPCEIHIFSQKIKFLGYEGVPRFYNVLLIFKPTITENRWFRVPRF